MGFFDAPVSGMDTFQQMMNAIGNNISNSNTVGFKSSEINFADMLSQTIKSGSGGATGTTGTGIGGTNPQQIGLGVKIAAINPVFTQGALTQTGTPSDLAIDGNGFFAVSPSAPSTKLSTTTTGTTTTASATPGSQAMGPIYYSRAGNFQVDNNGDLVTANGDYVLGIPLSPDASGTKNAALSSPGSRPTTLQRINVDINGTPAQYTIGNDGTVTVTNGTDTFTYQLPIVDFPNPSGLSKAGDNLYSGGGNAGSESWGPAGSGDFGAIQQGFLESSNVDLTKELSNMLIAQTGYSSNSKVINVQNQMFQQLIQNV